MRVIARFLGRQELVMHVSFHPLGARQQLHFLQHHQCRLISSAGVFIRATRVAHSPQCAKVPKLLPSFHFRNWSLKLIVWIFVDLHALFVVLAPVVSTWRQIGLFWSNLFFSRKTSPALHQLCWWLRMYTPTLGSGRGIIAGKSESEDLTDSDSFEKTGAVLFGSQTTTLKEISPCSVTTPSTINQPFTPGGLSDKILSNCCW